MISLDGIEWAEAIFPPDFMGSNVGYTILESPTGGIFLGMLTNKIQSYGSLFKSNWNGTYFTLLLDHMNQDGNGHVDFEKLQGLKGVALANQQRDPNNYQKFLVTKITYDDGLFRYITDIR